MSSTQPEVIVHVAPGCGYCRAAKDLLARKGVTFREIDVSIDETARARMVELSGRTTVPQVFVGDRPVGGYDDLAQLERTGRLEEVLGGG